MPAERCRATPAITFFPRNSLSSSHHKGIDGLLKDLKTCSRRLRAAMSSFTDELRILDRLYYKNKNQHRTALFFRRVPEIRRYGQRLVELDLSGRVDLLRASFVGLTSTTDQKALSKTWSHVPEQPYVSFVMERLVSCSTLVCKMRERLQEAYHHFTLAMQSGAFIQLIVLFAAISSRMSALSLELEEVLHLGASTCDRLLVILDPTHESTTKVGNICEHPFAGPAAFRPLQVDPEASVEDVGQSISRHVPIPICIPIIEHSTVESDPVTMLEMRITPPVVCTATDAVERTIVRASEPSTVKVVKSSGSPPQKPRPKKARKKKQDEIDDIFGF
ncbi:hypothetical protein BDN67DRAFT_962484 [Paxillus ammoniavirescens]|nr:hypothetical protein BDN67DRAFT_962484 [Paxillus ammoniavirescens]